MASQSGRTSPAVSEQLRAEPYRFDFFQAVRLFESLARETSPNDRRAATLPVGGDGPPGREALRFRAVPALTFPAGEISEVRSPALLAPPPPATATPSSRESAREPLPARPDGRSKPTEMTVAFMGLTGPSGVLPMHYTSLVIERSHTKHKDYSLRDFLDLFNHRAVSLFYRAWDKYRFPVGYERAKQSNSEDLFTFCLYCLVGLGTAGLRGRMRVDDEAILYYGGHYAHRPRSANSLERLLADYFDLPVTLEQFSGQWLYLSESEQSCFPSARHPGGLNMTLGESVIVGERVWDTQSKFRVRLGPVGYAWFARLMPSGDALGQLGDLVRLYVGPEFDFDVQPVLLAREVPWCELTDDPARGPRLGWNTWVRNGDFAEDVRDAVFQVESN
jgi:type VI secretion system protein ImpH